MRLLVLALVPLVVCCGSREALLSADAANLSAAGGLGCQKVGVLLPEEAWRWSDVDGPLLAEAIGATGAQVRVLFGNKQRGAPAHSFNSLQAYQKAQATKLLRWGACILVVAAYDSVRARDIVSLAAAHGVPVISHDGLIDSSRLSFRVAFDGEEIGGLQGRYIADHYKAFETCGGGGGHELALFHGAPDDPNSRNFRNGAMEQLQPLVDAHALNPIYDAFTPFWDPYVVKDALASLLDANGNRLQVAYSANDDNAWGALLVLRDRGMNGRVLLTGQDATLQGVAAVLLGNQAMTVHKPIEALASATASLINAMRTGGNTAALTQGHTSATSGGALIPTVAATPVAIDRCNVKSLILDRWAPDLDLCSMLPPAACAGLEAGTALCDAAPTPACPPPPVEPVVLEPADYESPAALAGCWNNICLHNCHPFPREVDFDGSQVVPRSGFGCGFNDPAEEGSYDDRVMVVGLQRRPAGGLVDLSTEPTAARVVPWADSWVGTATGAGLPQLAGYCYRTVSAIGLTNGYLAETEYGPFHCF